MHLARLDRYDERIIDGTSNGYLLRIYNSQTRRLEATLRLELDDDHLLLDENSSYVANPVAARRDLESAILEAASQAVFYGRLSEESDCFLRDSHNPLKLKVAGAERLSATLPIQPSFSYERDPNYELDAARVVQLEILRELRTAYVSGVSPATLASKLDVPPAEISSQVARLLERGAVRTSSNGGEVGDTHVFITEAGVDSLDVGTAGPAADPSLAERDVAEARVTGGLTGPTCFLCHSSQDKDAVRRIALDLEQRGLRVWFDEWELQVGDSLHDKISEGLDSSGYLVVFLSPSSVASGWARKEMNAGLARELELRSVFVLPVLLKECRLPAFLKDKKYADFRRNYDEGLRALVGRLLRAARPTAGRAQAADSSDDLLQGGSPPLGFCPKCGGTHLKKGTDLVVEHDSDGPHPVYVDTVYCADCEWETRDPAWL